MKLRMVQVQEVEYVILLDGKMRLVIPVFDYLRFLRQKGRARNTLIAYGRDLKLYWEFIESSGYEYDQVTPLMIAEFVEYLRQGDRVEYALYRESERSNSSINRILSTVHQFYVYCATMLDIDNPILMQDRNRPPNMFKDFLHHARTNNRVKQNIFKTKTTNHAIRLITEDEMHMILAALPKKRDQLLYKVLYYTGARIREALDLQIEDIPVPDLSQKVGVLPNIKSKGKHRDLYIPMFLIRELDDFILYERSKIETEHGYIFVSEQPQTLGNPLSYVAAYDRLNSVRAKTGITFTFHDFRHSYASRLAEMGMDQSVIRLIMGHEHISTTQRYTHLSQRHVANSLARYYAQGSLQGGDLTC